jgi:8-oxo-dGTP pyrophosphatase MutT (NUDIX family)
MPQYFTGVLGLIVNHQHQFLLTQRNQPETPSIHQGWQVPGGGVEFTETPTQTLIREMQEELSVTPTILFPYPMARTQVWRHEAKPLHLTLLCFVCVIGQQQPVIGDPETLDFNWLKREELYGFKILPNTIEICDEATKICNQYGLWPK